jgi:hypothetical protein
MTKLLEKNKAFDWREECQTSFEGLKKCYVGTSVDSNGFDQEV